MLRSAREFVLPVSKIEPASNNPTDDIALASFQEETDAAQEADTTVEIFVVGHGWHTGLVLPPAHIASADWPELASFSEADYVEIGWGDEGFYRAQKITAGLVTKAAFWPTPSVLHLAAFRGDVETMFPHSDVVSLRLARADFDHLTEFISQTFDREAASESLGPGLYADSRFYRAKGKYFVPKTCNVWTAQALKVAGLRMRTWTSMTAESVLKQARNSGTDRQRSAKWAKRAALGLSPE
jgi:uncharacterized protein (TIGR02117 family)